VRRIVVLALISVAMVLGTAAVAGAYPGDPGSPDVPGVEVGGISVSRSDGAATSNENSSAALAFTGSDGTSTLLWVGGAFVLAGGAVVVMTRRRHSAQRA
jgi:LPXTG-motif cell wall-anchored protein